MFGGMQEHLATDQGWRALCAKAQPDEKDECLRELPGMKEVLESAGQWDTVAICLNKHDLIDKKAAESCITEDVEKAMMEAAMKEMGGGAEKTPTAVDGAAVMDEVMNDAPVEAKGAAEAVDKAMEAAPAAPTTP